MTVIWTASLVSPGAGNSGYSERNLASSLSAGGNRARVTFVASSSGPWVVSHASIAVQSSGANSVSTPIELLFGGVSGFSLSAGQNIVSDYALISFLMSDTLIVVSDTQTGNMEYTGSGSSGVYDKAATTSYNQASVSGFSLHSGSTYGISQIEAQPAIINTLNIPILSSEFLNIMPSATHIENVLFTLAEKLIFTATEIGVLTTITTMTNAISMLIKQPLKNCLVYDPQVMTFGKTALKYINLYNSFIVKLGQFFSKIVDLFQTPLLNIITVLTDLRRPIKIIPIDTAYGSSNVVRFYQNQIYNPIYVNDSASVVVSTSILFSEITPEGAPAMTNQNLKMNFTRPDGSTFTKVFPFAYIGEIDLPSPLGYYYGGSYAVTPFAANELNQSGVWTVELAFANFNSPAASFTILPGA